jgi:hypothetical protein
MENAKDKKIDKEVVLIKSQTSQAMQAAQKLEIKADADMQGASELFLKIKAVGNLIKKRKDTITRPLYKMYKDAMDYFKPLEQEYINAERIVSQKISDYRKKQEEKATKETIKIEEKVEMGKIDFQKATEKIEKITPQKSVESGSGTVQFRTIKEVIVEDETKIPREYFVLDMIKVRKVALAGVDISGVKIVDKQVVAGVVK